MRWISEQSVLDHLRVLGETIKDLGRRVQALEETTNDPTGDPDQMAIATPLEFLRSHPGVRFTIDTLIVNTHQSEGVIQRTLDLDYSFRRIRKGHYVRTNIIYYWWESSLDLQPVVTVT